MIGMKSAPGASFEDVVRIAIKCVQNSGSTASASETSKARALDAGQPLAEAMKQFYGDRDELRAKFSNGQRAA